MSCVFERIECLGQLAAGECDCSRDQRQARLLDCVLSQPIELRSSIGDSARSIIDLSQQLPWSDPIGIIGRKSFEQSRRFFDVALFVTFGSLLKLRLELAANCSLAHCDNVRIDVAKLD